MPEPIYRKKTGDDMNRLTIDEFKEAPKHPITLLLHNIRSMWNVGALFRVADAARIEKIIISGYTATPPRKEIEKTALGATDTVVWLHRPDPIAAIEEQKQQGIVVLGLEITDHSRVYHDLEPKEFPLCIVLGNEVTGIEDEVLSHCNGVLEIPQYGTKHSLNVAVAGGIAVFDAVRLFRLYHHLHKPLSTHRDTSLVSKSTPGNPDNLDTLT